MVKVLLNTVTRECSADSNFLGFEGENQANVLDFSFSDKFIDGTAVLNIKRGKDVGFVSVDKVGNGYQLPVKSSLLSQVGDITFQFVVTTPSGTIMKFDSFVMTVEDAIDTDVPLPEEYPTWVEMANTKLAEIDAAVARANATSAQILQDKANGVFDGKDGATGPQGPRGEQGVRGERGPQGETGAQGPQGPAGADGNISFEELPEEQKVSLRGEAGPQGPAGADGITPHIGANGNWWIGDIDTGVAASVAGSKITTLWEGTLATSGNSVTLSDSIANYDFVLVEAQIIVSSTQARASSSTMLLSTDGVIQNSRGYNLFTGANPNEHWYRVSFNFPSVSTLQLVSANVSSNAWSTPHIYKVTGIRC